MAMNPMQKKARISFLLGVLITLLITGLIIGFLILQLTKIKQEQAKIVYKDVYIASGDILSGEKIQGKYSIKTIDSSLVPVNALTTLDMGTYLTDVATSKITLKMGTVLTAEMINTDGRTETADYRLEEYNMVVLPTELQEGEYVDIRLRLPSGENYIVLSKKYVEKTDGETIWVKVGEDEILTMSNAIVESYIMDGSLLYAVPYTDAGIQNSAITTYIASDDVNKLILADPNVTDIASSELRARFQDAQRDATVQKRTAINSAVNGVDETEALSNVQENTSNEMQKRKAARQAYIESLGL